MEKEEEQEQEQIGGADPSEAPSSLPGRSRCLAFYV